MIIKNKYYKEATILLFILIANLNFFFWRSDKSDCKGLKHCLSEFIIPSVPKWLFAVFFSEIIF